MIPVRLSGTTAQRPTAANATGARYYDTTTEEILISTGAAWVSAPAVGLEHILELRSGLLADRPATPGNVTGIAYIDEDGIAYEAFPGAWGITSLLCQTSHNTVLAPVVATAPAVTGTIALREVLSVSDGTWTNGVDFTYAYEWYRYSGAGAAAIDGETGDTYTLTEDDVGFYIRAWVTVSNGFASTVFRTEPTDTLDHVDGTWVITITGTPVGTILLNDFVDNTTGTITFGTDIDVTSGVAATIAENLKVFINDLAITGWTATRALAVVTVTVTPDADLPLDAATDSATNLTIVTT